MAEKQGSSVASMLLGESIPLTNAEFELYKTYQKAQVRLDYQREKGIV